MLLEKALCVLINLSQLVSAQMEKPILHVHGWINSQIKIAVAGSYSHMICGTRLTSPVQDRDNDWRSDSGLGLVQ